MTPSWKIADPLDATLLGMMRLRSPSGQFETTTFLNPTTALALRGTGITVTSTDPGFAGQLSIVDGLAGDYNSDNSVDAADYVGWRKMLGTTNVSEYSGGDGDGDRRIDQDDYALTSSRATAPHCVMRACHVLAAAARSW
jgi:hypothetical protein